MNASNTTQEMRVFRLPDVGEGLTEAEIVAWHVAAGDQVAVNQVLVEIETAKSIVELPSPFEGTVAALLAVVGETVPVGNAIIEVAAAGVGVEGSPASDATVAQHEHASSAGEPSETPKLLVGYGATDPDQSRRRRARGSVSTATSAAAPTAPAQAPPAPKPQAAAVHAPAEGTPPGAEKPRAKPPVRGLAKQLGIDLSRVTASGPNGTVSREDVRRAAEVGVGDARGSNHCTHGSEPLTQIATDEAAPTRIPIKGVRKATAAAMVASAFTAPHVTEFVTIDVTRSLELLAELQLRREFSGIKLTPLALVARSYLRAIARTPMATAHWNEDTQEIVLPGTVHLGIAAATPRGLLVPNIKHADDLGLRDLAQAIGDLAATARAGKTQPADLAHGSTTITNIGVFGIDTGTPILNPGETAILAMGAIQRRPWVVGTGADERIEARSVMQLALSFDHRVLDGAEGSRLLADTAEVLANPGLALL